MYRETWRAVENKPMIQMFTGEKQIITAEGQKLNKKSWHIK
jgi:hypothetical protein